MADGNELDAHHRATVEKIFNHPSATTSNGMTWCRSCESVARSATSTTARSR